MLRSAKQTDLDCMSIVKVLIIAKEHWITLDLKYRLQRLGYKTTVALEDFQDKISAEQPDLVLLDRQSVESEIMGAIEAAQLPALCFNAENQPFEIPVDLPYLTNPYQETFLDTAIRSTLRQHRTQLKLAQQLNDNQNQLQLLHTVDHELRTPLSTILITLDWIELIEQEELSARSLQKLDHLALARNSVRQMADFLDRTSLFCRCQAGKLVWKPIQINLSAFCNTLIAEVDQIYRSANIDFVCMSSNLVIEFDEMILRQILINLLSNAVKYSNCGSTVYLKLICHSERMIFQIQDSGIGISERDRDLIFAPLYRGSNVEAIPGTGMGLAIVQQLVSVCRGSITVESTPAIGSTFTVTLPVKA
ncbi:MAG: hybrid sensor histidine kinase/response regulator [Plectolyngbya sp. WJT66-NPBG17]|nr:hybrid sensor histidine kinase/response regulator [Plectolyngbya sp. WJT66-NPBG17]